MRGGGVGMKENERELVVAELKGRLGFLLNMVQQ